MDYLTPANGKVKACMLHLTQTMCLTSQAEQTCRALAVSAGATGCQLRQRSVQQKICGQQEVRPHRRFGFLGEHAEAGRQLLCQGLEP